MAGARDPPAYCGLDKEALPDVVARLCDRGHDSYTPEIESEIEARRKAPKARADRKGECRAPCARIASSETSFRKWSKCSSAKTVASRSRWQSPSKKSVASSGRTRASSRRVCTAIQTLNVGRWLQRSSNKLPGAGPPNNGESVIRALPGHAGNLTICDFL